MVGGLRFIRGFDPITLKLEEDKMRKERIRKYDTRMLEGMVRFANEALARGDIFTYADINYGILARLNPALQTQEAYDMTIRYFTGLPILADELQMQTIGGESA